MSRVMTDGSGSRPDWRPRAIRSGLELTLIVLSTTYLALQIEASLVVGLVLVVGLMASAIVVFWTVDDLVVDWVQYASDQARRRQRARRRQQHQRNDSE